MLKQFQCHLKIFRKYFKIKLNRVILILDMSYLKSESEFSIEIYSKSKKASASMLKSTLKILNLKKQRVNGNKIDDFKPGNAKVGRFLKKGSFWSLRTQLCHVPLFEFT